MKLNWKTIVAALLVLAFALPFLKQCQQTPPISQQTEKPAQKEEVVRKAPDFHADSAFYFIEKQLSFGFRTPNSQAHDKCAVWLVNTFKQFGAEVQVQTAKVKALDGKELAIQNVIASYNPASQRRVLLSAHWDSRLWADEDSMDKDKPIPAANDAGSGVAVLLEIARHLQQKSPNVGVDIILWDAEDYGKDIDSSYCLGTQYWAKHPHKSQYSAMYGINLDMVGAKNAQFPKEGISMELAAPYVDKLWNIANELGYGNYFLYNVGAGITDDHVFVNLKAKIPMLDVIDRRPDPKNPQELLFFPYWHTHKDDIDCIDKNTLKAVGQSVMEMIYRE